MKDKEFGLKFKASMEVDNIKRTISDLSKGLEDAGAKIPQGMSSSLSKLIKTLSSELTKIEGLTDIDLSPKDTKKVNQSYEKIFSTFQQIKGVLGDIKRSAKVDPEKFFPDGVAEKIEGAVAALKKYNKAIKTGIKTDEYKQIGEDLKKANRELNRFKATEETLDRRKQNLEGKRAAAVQKRAQASVVIEDTLAEKENAEAEVERVKKRKEAAGRLAQIEEELQKKRAALARKQNWATTKEDEKQHYKGSQDDEKYKEIVRVLEGHVDSIVKLGDEINKLESEQAELKLFQPANVQELEEAAQRAKDAGNKYENALKAFEDANNEIENYNKDISQTNIDIQVKSDEVLQARQRVENLRKQKEQLEAEFKNRLFGTLVQELKELNVELPQTGVKIEDVQAAISKLSTEAKNNLAKALQGIEDPLGIIVPLLESMGIKAREVKGFGESAERAARDMENLKDQVLEFFSISNTIQIFKNAIRDAVNTVKELDATMTETAVVTDFSIGDMWDKLPEYSAQATKLGTSINSLYEATTLYYQQGLNSNEAMGVGVETMKMARIANLDAADATKAMTAALRGFNMEINETSAQRINDVYSELAAITAADTSQIADAMTKTASIASSANMEFETTAALLAQIIETTQEAPETAGTAMKTIIARFTEVKELFSQGMLTGEDEEGEIIDINRIDAALRSVGISLKDFLNGSKGIDDIFLELASKWDSLDLATQRYIATTAAGSRQQSRFLAMMSNYDRTMELVTAANNSAGASQKQFGKTLDSLEAKLQKLKNAWDTFVMGLADNDVVKFGVDALTKILELANDLTDDLGSTVGSVAKLGLALTALKTGGNIFNSIFNPKEAQQDVAKLAPIAKILQNILTKTGVNFDTLESKTNKVGEGFNKALEATSKLTGGFLATGAACGLLGQYLEALGMKQAASVVEGLGAIVVTLGNLAVGFNSLATAMTKPPAALGAAIIEGLGAALPWIIGIGAALAVVGFTLKSIYNNSPAGKLKAAQKATKKAGEAAKKAAEEYNKLNSSLQSIEDKTLALNELTKGTQEWREAVSALNNDIIALVETYPELASFLSNEGGVLKIDYKKTATNKQGQEYTAQNVLDSYIRKQIEAQQIYNHKQISEKRAEIDLQYARSVNKFSSTLSFLDIEKAEKESETGSSWDDARKIVDKLAIEIAKGKVQTDESFIQNWLKEQNVLTRDFEEFDYSTFKTYGDYLISQQEAIDGLTDATIAAHMAMLKLSNVSNEATEAVTNFDENVLRDIYNTQLEEAKSRDITRDDYLAYAEEMGYTYKREYKKSPRARSGKYVDRYYDENNQKVTIDEDSVRDFIVNRATNKDFEAILQKIAEHYDSADEREQELFSEVFSEGTKNLSRNTLSQYGVYDKKTGQFGFTADEAARNEFAKAMGFKGGFKELAEVLETDASALAKQLDEAFTEGGAEFLKVRKNLVKNMAKYSKGSGKNLDINTALLNALEVKYKDLDIASMMSNVFEQLDKTGDMNLSTAAYEALRDIMMEAEGAGQMQDAFGFFNKIDFNNPISALETINKELKTGSGYSVDLARAIKNSDSSFLGLSSQLSTFINSENFEDVKEDLDEIIEKNGEIAATDVLELSKSYKDLNKILNNNEVSAAALAKVLNGISDGTLQVEELTDTVLAAVSSFDSLDSIVAKTIQGLEDFDLGPDENEVGKTAKEWSELILENIKSGAVGNSQNFKILDYLFPGWDEGLDGDKMVAEMKRLANKIGGNGQNLRKLWSDLADGKDYKGNEANFEGEGLTEEEKKKFKDLKVTDTGKEIQFTGWEGKGLTSDDLVTWIADAYSTSKEMASLMLVDFKNYSKDLAAELRENDFAVGMEKAYESLHQLGETRFIDEKELQTIADYLGTSVTKVKEELESYGDVVVTDFYNIDGSIKSFEEISKQASALGGEAGAQWSKGFTEKVNKLSGKGYIEVLDISALEKELANLGITGTFAEQIKQQAFQSIRDGLIEGGKDGYASIESTLIDGSIYSVTVTPEMDYSQYEAEVEKANRRILNEETAKAFADMLTGAKASIEIDEDSLAAIPEAIRTTIEDAGITFKPLVDTTEIPGAIEAAKNQANRKVKFTAEMDAFTIDASGMASGTITLTPRLQSGVKNSNYYGPALVSEAGPELIQTKDGAYLTGLNGPEITNINKGDTVYTAQETKKILKSRNHKISPRFEPGLNNDGKASAYGDGSSYTGNKNGSGDKDSWENSFDKLYNLVREIDEQLHQRERIERRYEKLLDNIDVSSEKLIKVTQEQLAQLYKEKELQEQLIYNRRQQISLYQNENSDLTKYANVTQNEYGEDILRINWDLIDAVKDSKEGERVETYVNQLEEWFDSLEEAEDALWDIEDSVEDIKNRQKEGYVNLLDRVKDAILQSYQDEIDKLGAINDSINDTNSAILNSIQKSVNEQRQDRQNQKTQKSIEDKQRRLAYLQQDTSGANALEILRLQEEISQEQQDYTDSLIDQKISELQNQNDEAAEQRARQIEIAQLQLDQYEKTGQVWEDVNSLLNSALGENGELLKESDLVALLKKSENFEGLSDVEQMEWTSDLETSVADAVGYLSGEKEPQKDEPEDSNKPIDNIGNSSGGDNPNKPSSGGSGSGGGGLGNGGIRSDTDLAVSPNGYNTHGYTVGQVKDLQRKAGIQVDGIWGPATEEAYQTRYESIAYLNGKAIIGKGPTASKAEEDLQNKLEKLRDEEISILQKQIGGTPYYNTEKNNIYGKYGNLWTKRHTKARFASGGLADFTGPAWLDGTKSRPEYVLNAAQTQRFFDLIDILDDFKNNTNTTNSQNFGAITYDIDINIDTVKEEADVDMIVEKVQKSITATSKYRANNFVKR